jgi:hypothetical protein
VKKIVSIGQFRPEKDHASQIRAMFALRQIIDDKEWEKVKHFITFYFALLFCHRNISLTQKSVFGGMKI